MSTIDGKKVRDLIQKHAPRRKKMIRLYQNYKGENLAIEGKEVYSTSKVNNKIKNDYRGLIIDQHNGYLLGKPIQFGLDSLKYPQNVYDLYYNELQTFLIRNNADDVIPETDKMSRICGYSAWLCYFDKDAKERFMEVYPWNTIFEKDPITGEDIRIYYYEVEKTDEKGVSVIRTKAEVYDDRNVTYFVSTANGEFVLDPDEKENPRPHHYYKNPLIQVKNNEELIGDFEKVEDLIDKYDYLISVVQDEVEQFRLAYMLVTGAELTEETIEKIKATGAFTGLGPEDKVEFITKEINDTFIENHKKTLNENIYKFSCTIDMSDEKFSGGTETGESRKWKLLALENKAIIKERKIRAALRELFEVICSSWNQNKGFQIDPYDIYFTFSRNIPVDLLYLADVSARLKGLVSEDTRLSLLGGIVDDVEWEKKKMQQDKMGTPLDSYEQTLFGQNGVNGSETS